MKTYLTEIKAICPITGELSTFAGPEIEAVSFGMAEIYCQENGLGYCRVTGELMAKIPCKKNTMEADFDNMANHMKGLN